jgi:hypothetical protein
MVEQLPLGVKLGSDGVRGAWDYLSELKGDSAGVPRLSGQRSDRLAAQVTKRKAANRSTGQSAEKPS